MTLSRLLGAAALLAATAPVARAITVDGKLDPGYTLLSVQTTQTSPGPDATSGASDFAAGSELDAAYGAVDQGVLYLFFAGNLRDAICGGEACTDADILELFFDSQPGGQNQLTASSPAPDRLAGITFDTAFVPDEFIEFLLGGALDLSFVRFANFGTLPTGGGGTLVSLGSGSNTGAPGTLSGGTNPFGIQATIDNSNTAGVTAGCAAGTSSGVTTGVEIAVPLAAIGAPTGCIKLSAFALRFQFREVSNQVLGPLPPGTCSFGDRAGANFADIPGDQFFTICLDRTAARRSTWGQLKSIYR